MLKFYQYARCSTCVKASKFLAKKNIKFKSIEIVDEPPSLKELKKMLSIYQGDIKKLFNTSGLMYKEMDMKTKIKTMTEKDLLTLLSENGKLIKRPFLIEGDLGLVGFKEAEYDEIC